MGLPSFTAGVGVGLLAAFAMAVRARVPGFATPDERLAARVRDAMARVAARPSHLVVVAEGQTVVLAGRAQGDELEALLEAVRAVPGVERVIGRLDVFEDESPPLRGERPGLPLPTRETPARSTSRTP